MAKTRMINTRFWNDGYIAELEPVEKLLFLYFLTNGHANICGVYELPIRTVAFETGIEEEKVRNILSRFAVDGKIEYVDGWVVVKNFLKHQQQASTKVARGIELALMEIPQAIRDRVSIVFDTTSHSNSNPDSNSNSDSKATAHLDYLSNIPPDDLKELSEKYEASTGQIKRKAETMKNYCLSKGKTYKNYRAFLENGLDRDFGRRVKIAPKVEENKPMTPEQRASLERVSEQIKNLGAAKRIEN